MCKCFMRQSGNLLYFSRYVIQGNILRLFLSWCLLLKIYYSVIRLMTTTLSYWRKITKMKNVPYFKALLVQRNPGIVTILRRTPSSIWKWHLSRKYILNLRKSKQIYNKTLENDRILGWPRTENENSSWVWPFHTVIRFMVNYIMPPNFRS